MTSPEDGMFDGRWQNIPDSILLDVFAYLEAKDLLRSAQSCITWNRVACQDSLWKNVVQTKWKIKGPLADGKNGWKSEYKRLYYHTPTELSETLVQHTDEVLDVSFSNNGKLFCTTSRDATVKIWEIGYPTKLKFNAKLLLTLGWNMTQYSVFNKSDTLLCVCGLKIPSDSNIAQNYPQRVGYGAIFRMSDFQLLQTMHMDPPHLFADWFDDRIMLGGYLDSMLGVLHIKAFEIDIKTPLPDGKEKEADGVLLYSLVGNHHHTMNMLVANVPMATSVTTSQHATSNIISESSASPRAVTREYFQRESKKSKLTDRADGKVHIGPGTSTKSSGQSEIKKEMDKGSTRSNEDELGLVTCKTCTQNTCDTNTTVQKMLIFVSGEHDAITIRDISDLPDRLRAKKSKRDRERNGLKNHLRHVLSRSSSTQEAIIDQPTASPEFLGYYISGLRLSPDNKWLYFNHRKCNKDEVDQDGYPVLGLELLIEKIDLQKIQHYPNLYKGHKASSTYPAWYICLDLCDDYIASGSEDAQGYLWDSHYGCILATYSHRDGVVNGVEFCPVDNECIVTAADDSVIKIWRSKNRQAEIINDRIEEPMEGTS